MVSDEPLTPAGRLFLESETEQIINVAIKLKNPINVESFKNQFQNSHFTDHPRFTSLLVRKHFWRQSTVDIDRHVIVIPDSEKFKDQNDGEKLVDGVVNDEKLVNDGEDDLKNDEKSVNEEVCAVNEELKNEEDVLNDEILVNDEVSVVNEENVVNGDKSVNEEEDQVNEYLADLSVSSPLSTDKPLWEIHFLLKQNVVVLRLHHALGDGISLMSLFIASCRKSDNPESMPTVFSSDKGEARRGRTFWEILKICWVSLVFVIGMFARVFVKDEETAVRGGAGVELWPRKLATARFLIEDMKVVKKVVPNGTINDVLFGVISLGLSTYLDLKSSKALKEGLQITGMAMVNLRKQPGLQELTDMMKAKSKSRWGNKFGIVLLPLYYHKPDADPLQYLKRSKAMLDQKKQSLEAHFSYMVGDFIMSFLGPRAASWLNYRIMCNTTFTISNIIGPQEEMTFAGNPIASLKVNSTALPHAVTMHMASYAGKAHMQILAPKEIIPDPKVLAKCFEDALFDMKEAAMLADVTAAKL